MCCERCCKCCSKCCESFWEPCWKDFKEQFCDPRKNIQCDKTPISKRLLYTPQCAPYGCCCPEFWYLIFTGLCMLYHSGWIYKESTKLNDDNNDYRNDYILYFSNWSYILLLLYNIVDVFNVLYFLSLRKSVHPKKQSQPQNSQQIQNFQQQRLQQQHLNHVNQITPQFLPQQILYEQDFQQQHFQQIIYESHSQQQHNQQTTSESEPQQPRSQQQNVQQQHTEQQCHRCRDKIKYPQQPETQRTAQREEQNQQKEVFDNPPMSLYASWGLFEINNTAAVCVSLGYLGSVLSDDSEYNTWTTREYHIFNIVYILLNFFICAKQVRVWHVMYPLVYGIIYLGFSAVSQLVFDCKAVYKYLKWSNLELSIGISVVVLCAAVVCHFSFFILFKLRVFIAEKCFNRWQCCIIPVAPYYEIYISQLRNYSKKYGKCKDFLVEGTAITNELLNKRFHRDTLKKSLNRFYSLNHDLVDRYKICIFHMTIAMFPVDNRVEFSRT